MKRGGFFAMLARMKHIARWGLMRNTMRESLSQHSFDTAVIAHGLAIIGKERFKKDIDPAQIAAAALFHDSSEILTGDLPTPVKYNNHSIKDAFHALEREARTSLLSMLPDDLRPPYEVLFNFDVCCPTLSIYVKAADKISAYIKCIEEQKSGNREFDSALLQLEQAIKSLNLPEATVFMTEFLPAFSMDLDSLQV